MSLRLVMMLGLCFAVEVAAQDMQPFARNLNVHVEQLEGDVALNGVPVTITRAEGPGVPALAERMINRWRSESGPDSVWLSECCGWKLASRIHNGESQVVQWRTTVTDSELLWSTLVATAPPPAPPMVNAPLPPDCRWSGPVHGKVAGNQYVQISARCALDPQAALDLMIRRLASAGWRWQRQGRLVVHAARGQVRAQLIAAPMLDPRRLPAPGQSSLVLLEARPSGGSFR